MIANYLAEIWGISITVVALALLMRESFLSRLFALLESEECLFLTGLVSFVVGLAMILAYNVWAKNWQFIITILGWLTAIKGLALIFFPQRTKMLANKLNNKNIMPFVLVIMVFVGLALTYLGFTK